MNVQICAHHITGSIFVNDILVNIKNPVDSGPGNLVSNIDSVFMMVNNDEKSDLLCPIGQKGL